MSRNELGDFSGNMKQVRMFVHLGRCLWLLIVHCCLTANVPIWFLWGNVRHGLLSSEDWVNKFRPTQAQILSVLNNCKAVRDEMAADANRSGFLSNDLSDPHDDTMHDNTTDPTSVDLASTDPDTMHDNTTDPTSVDPESKYPARAKKSISHPKILIAIEKYSIM